VLIRKLKFGTNEHKSGTAEAHLRVESKASDQRGTNYP